MNRERVSIITPCYNGEKYLDGYYKSIIAQTYDDVELVFVDDGSTDNTSRISKEYGKRLRERGYEFKYIYQSNKGQAAAVNVALKEITGDYLMWMDADDIMYPDKIRKELEFLDNHKECAFVQCWYEFVDENRTDLPIDTSKGSKRINRIDFFEDLINARNVIFSGIYLVRVSALHQVLSKFQIYESKEGQNWQLLLPLAAEYECGYVEEVLFKVVSHNDSHSRLKRSYSEMIRRNKGLRDILVNTISNIESLQQEYKKNLLKRIDIEYCERNARVALENLDYEEWLKAEGSMYYTLTTKENQDRKKSVAPYENCYGCGACVSICEQKAIIMKETDEGFLFPFIIQEKCINCHECKAVCPVYNFPLGRNGMSDTFLFKANDDIRNNSSSGGAFTAIAKYIITNNGYVCGCSFTDDYLNVEHIIVHDIAGLQKLQKSKYIQSYAGSVYPMIKELLVEGKTVLFVGTPCQVAGLKLFLKKDYKHLLTMDLVCHGVPSKKAWQKYLEWQFSPAEKIVKADFRDSSNKTTPTLKLNTCTDTYTYTYSEYYKAFSDNIDSRRSCGHCPYPYHRRPGDISIGDFWGADKLYPELYDAKGCSVVILNSKKAEMVMTKIEQFGQLNKVTYENVEKYNALLVRHSFEHPGRKVFYNYLNVGKDFLESYRMAKNEMYDLGLITWWFAPNYGAALTAFALYEYLCDMGFSVLMPDVPDYVLKGDVESRLKDSPTRVFIQKYCIIGERYKDEVDVLHLNRLCRNYIVGSDQLWNCVYGQFDSQGAYYFLDFAGNNKGKISYGTSFGEDCFRDDKNKIKVYINQFDAVSVREEAGVEICKVDFGKEAALVVDPVFLIDNDRYRQIASSSRFNLDEDYTFVYMMRPTPEKWVEIVEGCRCNNNKIYYCTDLRRDLQNIQDYFPEEIEKISCPSVEDWLYLLIHASTVYTDSYHGICMSIIMKKNCIQLNREEQVGRFDSLYKMLAITNKKMDTADYNTMSNKLEAWRLKSKKWLNNSLLEVGERGIMSEERYKDELQLQWKMIRSLQQQISDNRKILMKVYIEGRIAGKRIVIRGGGKHTEELLKLIDSRESIIGIWDPTATVNDIFEKTCFKTWEECCRSGAEYVLVSSYKYKDQIVGELRDKGLSKYIIEPYSEWRKMGIIIEREFYK